MQFEKLLSEITWKAVKSSGPGGQHVNKTASKIELSINILTSEAFSENEKQLLTRRLSNRISESGMLIIQCSESRSQHRNKKIAIKRLEELLKGNLTVAKARKKSKPSKSAIEKRLKAKKEQGLKKSRRKPPKLDP
ncbi:MAG: aminoacyl-tRNA hydrolase [Flavobacteriaceae bacterium]|nr:aminoacyl-tRNA hydrolase [Flavobacteriaceae bacterium]